MKDPKAFMAVSLPATLVLVAVSMFLYHQVADKQQQLVHLLESREESYRLADELRQSSDDLTRMARTYAVTGEERFRQYFDEIAAIRGGYDPRPENYHLVYWDLVTEHGPRPRDAGETVALRSLMQDAGITEAELNHLKISEDRSNRLIELEEEAFVAAAAGDTAHAQELLHSREYHLSKKGIMEPILDFFIAVDGRISSQITETQASLGRMARYFTISITLSLLLAILSVVANRTGRAKEEEQA